MHKIILKFFFFVIVIFSLLNCSKKINPVVNNDQSIDNFDDDLSEFRPKSNLENNNVNISLNEAELDTNPADNTEKVNAILDAKAEKNKNVKFANGYRIQVYVGKERKTLDEAKVYIYTNFPGQNPYLTFSQPFYKLKIGDFLTQNDAQKIYTEIKSVYPDAIILQEPVDIKKSFQGNKKD